MKKLLIFAIPLMIVLFIMCGDSSTKSKDTATLSGVVINQDGDPIYGAVVTVGTKQGTTNQTGSFSMSVSTGNQNVLIAANGYQSVSGSVDISKSGAVLDTVVLPSYNATRLGELTVLSNLNAYQKLTEYCGFQVNNNAATNDGYANAHLNMLMSLDNLNKTLTLGEIIAELGVSGVLDGNNYSFNSDDFINTLQALFEIALTKPNDPRSLPLLYMMMNDNGTLPTTVPVINYYTAFKANKSMILLSSLRFLAEHHPTDVSLGKASVSHSFSKPAQLIDNILTAWYNTPISKGTFDAQGTKSISTNTTGLVGLYIGFGVSTGLSYQSASSQTPLMSYMIGTTLVSDRVFGGWLATELYKMWANRVGEPMTNDDIVNITVGEDGNLIIASDIRVTLTWTGGEYTDVDLHFIDPNGERCYYGHSVTAIGAELDVDDVDGYGPENIVLEPGEAIPGTYSVEVNYYSDEGWTGQPIYATVTITLHEGSANQVRQTFGPHAITVCDYNGNNPDAWWSVATINYTTGMISIGQGLQANNSPRPAKTR